jgi:hypothetical protein
MTGGRLFVLWPQHRLRASNRAALYTRGVCDRCKLPRGKRTTVAARVPSIDAGVHLTSIDGRSVVSESLRSLLRPAERSAFRWLSVDVRDAAEPYFEIVASRRHARLTWVKHASGRRGWRCESCKQDSIAFHVITFGPSFFVSRADVGTSRPAVMTVGGAHSLRLTIRADRFAALKWKKPFKHPTDFEVFVAT